MSVKLTVETADRVDKAIAAHYPEAGRKQLAALFEDGAVKIGKRTAKKGDRVAIGDVIELARAPITKEEMRVLPDAEAGAALDILLERPELVAVNKPAGQPSQPLRAGELGTVANALAARFPACASLGDDPRDGGLVHRLDIGTSGALVAARSAEVWRALRDAFGAGLVEKQYLALVDGRPVSRESDAPLAQRGKRVAVDMTDGLAAYTEFRVEAASATHALVRCLAATGRMHQVRAHLAHVGSPITGDALYGGAPLPGAADDGFFLHAASLVVPVGPERLSIEAPLPARFTAALAAVGIKT